ncbi:hypothetical protein JKP88DRAFT_261349 [Tribonema minus]|uniref:Uncharacterized protein n=1 Tax=Tribonema minus TaxID=303371 RepID=A0A835YRA0_9STRA|nr:hypothetical protein JKP88DRAFT_261349 [Tribonema minus]
MSAGSDSDATTVEDMLVSTAAAGNAPPSVHGERLCAALNFLMWAQDQNEDNCRSVVIAFNGLEAYYDISMIGDVIGCWRHAPVVPWLIRGDSSPYDHDSYPKICVWTSVSDFRLMKVAGALDAAVCKAPPDIVDDHASAMKLTEAAVCRGQNIEVEWRGFVKLTEPIILGAGTTLVINGRGTDSEPAAISGQNETQLLRVRTGASVTLRHLRLRDGRVSVDEGYHGGGAVSVFEAVGGAEGGAIYNSGHVTSHSTAFDQNLANSGGAIYNSGDFTSTNSTFATNRATTPQMKSAARSTEISPTHTLSLLRPPAYHSHTLSKTNMDYTLTVRSRDAVNATDTAWAYEVQVPDMPIGPYRASVTFIAASLTATVVYALQFNAPEITRCLDTSITGSDGWETVALLNGADMSAPGVFYCDRAPRRLKVRVLIPATLALAVTLGHHFISVEFKNIANCDE